MYYSTLKPDEKLLDVATALDAVSFTFVGATQSLIPDESMNTDGKSSFIHLFYKLNVPATMSAALTKIDYLTPPAEITRPSQFSQFITGRRLLASKTIGLPFLANQNLYVVKSVEFRGSLHFSTAPESCAQKNKAANAANNETFLNKDKISQIAQEVAPSLTPCAKMMMKSANRAIIKKHAQRIPSFTLSSFNGRKERIEHDAEKKAALTEKITRNSKSPLSPPELALNSEIAKETKDFLLSYGAYNLQNASKEYLELFLDFLKIIPEGMITCGKYSNKALEFLTRKWAQRNKETLK